MAAKSTTYEPDEARKAQLAIVDTFDKYRERAIAIRAERGQTPKYKTKWPLFNQYLGGGFGSEQRGELVIIAGETGTGKTTFVGNIIRPG